MLDIYLQQALSLYERTDAILITDRYGNIEYSMMVTPNGKRFESLEFTGMHILEAYPELTEETSTVMRVLNKRIPILDEEQILTTCNGREIHIKTSTLPIIVNGEIIGVINASVFIDFDERKYPREVDQKKTYHTIRDIITEDDALCEIKKRILRIATSSSNVLITGETGTGKELVAQSIHSHSARYGKPFVSQNCAAIPNSLLESMLFGTVKGSFTGADDKKGLFEIANHGTLFLDEINSMDMSIQAKLLKVLEDKTVRRIGDTRETEVDVRIVSAMNRDPLVALQMKEIREDLFYRICVVQIDIPPLRARKRDIDLLINHYINKYNYEMDRHIHGVSELVLNLFYQYEWPGNVRELKNIIEAAFNVAQSNLITMHDLPSFILNRNIIKNSYEHSILEESLVDQVARFEKDIIMNAVSNSKNMVEAARCLKISRQALQYKLNKYSL